MAEETPSKSKGSNSDCSICLQPLMHPVKLLCDHIFCFLCVKGVIQQQNNSCSLCRKVIPKNYLANPQFVKQTTKVSDTSYRWFYEGQSGWWQYDDRTYAEIEKAYQDKKEECEVLIAGNLYIIDLDKKWQYKKYNPGCRRRIKRDLEEVPKKGIAGIYLDALSDSDCKTSSSKSDDCCKSNPSTNVVIVLSGNNGTLSGVSSKENKGVQVSANSGTSSSCDNSCQPANIQKLEKTDGPPPKKKIVEIISEEESDDASEEDSESERDYPMQEETESGNDTDSDEDDKTTEKTAYEIMIEKKRNERLTVLESLKMKEVKSGFTTAVNNLKKKLAKPKPLKINKSNVEILPSPTRRSERLSTIKNKAIDDSPSTSNSSKRRKIINDSSPQPNSRSSKKVIDTPERNEEDTYKSFATIVDDSSSTHNSRKRRKIINVSSPRLSLRSSKKVIDTPERNEEDTYKSFATIVVSKLQEMTKEQRLFSEKLINDTLFKGVLGKLTEKSSIVETV